MGASIKLVKMANVSGAAEALADVLGRKADALDKYMATMEGAREALRKGGAVTAEMATVAIYELCAHTGKKLFGESLGSEFYELGDRAWYSYNAWTHELLRKVLMRMAPTHDVEAVLAARAAEYFAEIDRANAAACLARAGVIAPWVGVL